MVMEIITTHRIDFVHPNDKDKHFITGEPGLIHGAPDWIADTDHFQVYLGNGIVRVLNAPRGTDLAPKVADPPSPWPEERQTGLDGQMSPFGTERGGEEGSSEESPVDGKPQVEVHLAI